MSTELEIIPSSEDQQLATNNVHVVAELAEKYEDKLRPVKISFPDEQVDIRVPVSVLSLLQDLFFHMSKGHAVTLVPSDTQVSTQRAADLLNISRPFLIKLLERGEIPFVKVGTHRRIHLSDLNQYRNHMESQRRAALDELATQAQELKMGY